MAKEHFSHDHPLTFQQWQEGKHCSGCKFPIVHGSVYKCWECNFYLHEQCFKAKRYFKHPFHTTHPLNLHPKPTYPGRFFYCEICRQEGHGFSYGCSDCDFDLHIHCALAPLGTGGTGYSRYNYNYNYNYPQNASGSYGGGNYNNYYPQNSTPSHGGDYPAGYPPAGAYQYHGDNPQFHNNPSDYYATGNEFPQGNQQSADYADQYDPESTDDTLFPQKNFPNPAINQENRPTDAQFGQVSDAASDESIANSPNNTAALSNELSQTDDQYHPVLETAANASAGQYYSPQDGQSGPESDANRTTKVSRAGDENQALSQDAEHFVHHTLRPYNVPQGDPVLCSVCNQKLSGSTYRCSVHLHESCFHLVEQEEEEEEESGEHLVEASKDVAKSHMKIRKHEFKTTEHEPATTKIVARKFVATKTRRRPSQQKDQSLLTGSEDESEEGAKEEGEEESESTAHEPAATKIVARKSVAIKTRRKPSQQNDQSLLKDSKQELEECLEEDDDDGGEMPQKHYLIKLQGNMPQLKHKSEAIDHKLVDTRIVAHKSFATKTSQRTSQQNDPSTLKEEELEEDPEEEEEMFGKHFVESSVDSIEMQRKVVEHKHKSKTIALESVDTKIVARKSVATKTRPRISQRNGQSMLKEEESKEGQEEEEEEEMSGKHFPESSTDSAHKSVGTKGRGRLSQQDDQYLLKGSEKELKEGPKEEQQEDSGEHHVIASVDAIVLQMTKRLAQLVKNLGQNLVKFKIVLSFFTFSSRGWEIFLTGLFLIAQLIKNVGQNFAKLKLVSNFYTFSSWGCKIFLAGLFLIAQLIKKVGQRSTKFKLVSGFYTFSSWGWKIFMAGFFFIAQSIKNVGQSLAKFKLVSSFYTFSSWGWKVFLVGLLLIAQSIKNVRQSLAKFKLVSSFYTFSSWGWKVFLVGLLLIAQSIKNVRQSLAKISLSSHSFSSSGRKIFLLGLFFLITLWCLSFFLRRWVCYFCQAVTY
ncbi:uncharacterized protein LOC127802823 isoform X2 [Diospyros lotus]|uniref:uncharacterized protein LOC127802823 isoform X2 n=1 Tax=Diospyros lotus TaxID=55363 RepID=UPI00224EC499|nr:uncharacterized protein LOC127802823 isoform X2 [Diospyros lotus]